MLIRHIGLVSKNTKFTISSASAVVDLHVIVPAVLIIAIEAFEHDLHPLGADRSWLCRSPMISHARIPSRKPGISNSLRVGGC